jgi:hypothetical protein
VPERLAQIVVVLRFERLAHGRTGQRTGRRFAREPYSPHWGQARCGRCLEPHAGLVQVTSDGATAFH